MKTKLIIITLFVCIQNGTSQTIEEVLSNIYEQYSAKEPLQFKMNYNLYKSFDSDKVHQSYTGVYHKNASNDMYMKINETEILNNKEVSIKISHEDKALLLSNPELNVDGEYDMTQLLKVYKKNAFEDKGQYWEIELITSDMSLPYRKIVLQVTKDYFLKKQTYYYTTGINFSEDYRTKDIQTPKLEVVYTDYNRNQSDQMMFATNTFLELQKETASVVLSTSLQGYELLDQR